jgi:hypothetical protein
MRHLIKEWREFRTFLRRWARGLPAAMAALNRAGAALDVALAHFDKRRIIADRNRPKLSTVDDEGVLVGADERTKVSTNSSSWHITPVGGNIFADLGFPPEEAAALKAESTRIITEKLNRQRAAKPLERDRQTDRSDK